MSDCDCLPNSEQLAEMAEAARAGHRMPYVGSGDPDTVIGCGHDNPVRLGDLTEPAPKATCAGTTASGEPCKGRPGPDGFCAAHKQQKEEQGAGPVPPAVDTDPPA